LAFRHEIAAEVPPVVSGPHFVIGPSVVAGLHSSRRPDIAIDPIRTGRPGPA